MKVRIVPQSQAIERIAARRRPESHPGREPPMATKEKKSSGESREHRRSQESEREHAKPAEARSRNRDADDAHDDTSRGARGQADDKRQAGDKHQANDKREHASDRESRGGDARAR